MAAIREAISKLKAGAEESGTSTEDQEALEGLKTEKKALEDKIAEMEGTETSRLEQEAEVEEQEDRKDAEGLADRLGVDRTAWTKDTSAAQRHLTIAIHAGQVPSDAVLRSDSAPAGQLPATLKIVTRVLATQNPDGTRRRDAVDPNDALRFKQPPAKRADEGKDEPDPFLANVRKRQDDARKTA